MEIKVNIAAAGLNSDAIASQLTEGQLTFAKNAVISNFDGNSVTYQNEQSNILCTELPDGFRVVGVKNIIEQHKTIFFITNPTTNESRILARNNNDCTYITLVDSPCLNFNINYPIHKVVVKTTNCGTQLYWTDRYNPRRYLDLDNLPFQEVPDPNNSGRLIKTTTVDCNKLLLQPVFSIPTITPTSVDGGGILTKGTYQFAIQYSNFEGEGYTSYYSITNPTGIFEQGDSPSTTKSIRLNISNLDTTGLYEHYNLAVIQTVDNVPQVKLVGTFPITLPSTEYVYTGTNQSEEQLSINDIFEAFPYYDIAGDVTSSDNVLVWADLSTVQRINYQKVWSNVRLLWETWKLPYTSSEAYNDGINTASLKGYMRDEKYAFEGVFILTNGKVTESFHIPGRPPLPYDLSVVDNKDALSIKEDPCDADTQKVRWQVYNTATILGTHPDYDPNDNCYIGPYQYGEFGYWESTEHYPNNSFIWGDLANKSIRHHRFPDCIVSPIHDNGNGNISFEHNVYPIGVRVDVSSLYSAINALPPEERSLIAGFKITRANRAGNESIVAKGLLFNVGEYTKDDNSYLYPNYPYNDVRPDPFLSPTQIQPHSGSNAPLNGFTTDSLSRYTFHSPDTSFGSPTGIDSGYLKLETIEIGTSRGHFVEVKENAKYKFLTRDAIYLSFAAAFGSMVSFDTGGGFLGVAPSTTLDASSIPSTFAAMMQIIRDIAPLVNYGYQFNSIGNYHSSIAVPNDGNKIRNITAGGYILPFVQSIDTESINNINRESSVYIKISDTLPFTHEANLGAPQDISRYTLSETNTCNNPSTILERPISSYYASINRILPSQYGRIYTYETIDTGFYSSLYTIDNRQYEYLPTIFGGDTFINRFALKRKLPYFLDNTVGKSDETDIDYDLIGNVAYPNYYYSTRPIDTSVDLSNFQTEIDAILDTSFGNIIVNLFSGGVRPMGSALLIMASIFKQYLEKFGIANTNLDCYATDSINETGKAYLFSYGIPYFFVESTVNVDYRRATNNTNGDFYPHVGTDIPDLWLEEITTSITNDNTYTYDVTYSKQNKESFFSHLREDFDPLKLCLTNFPNRAIYSERSNLEESKNNWLIYRPLSYYDFPKNYGKLTSLDGLENRGMMVRFENKSLLYNTLVTVNTSVQDAYIGNPAFFSQPPLDYAESEVGYNGSQHKLFLKTEYGHLSVDAQRGQIFLIRGNQAQDITKGMSYWLSENLPFTIRSHFPTVNIDNHFNGVGITGVYDNRYNRIIITKKDYQPLSTNITYNQDSNKFFINDNEISLTDTNYFCNLSWTLSFSLETQSWISFHSYIPDFYIPDSGIFETSINSNTYIHNTALTFQNFYNQIEDYILEYPITTTPTEAILSSFSDFTTVHKYTSPYVYSEPEETVYFNQAVIYNDQQCTGYLNLIPTPTSNLRAYMQYPILNTSSKDILVSRRDNMYSFNTFWDIVQNNNTPFYSRPCNMPSLDKVFNINLDYKQLSHRKARMRAKESRVRLIQNKTDQYKLISKFFLAEYQKSIL